MAAVAAATCVPQHHPCSSSPPISVRKRSVGVRGPASQHGAATPTGACMCVCHIHSSMLCVCVCVLVGQVGHLWGGRRASKPASGNAGWVEQPACYLLRASPTRNRFNPAWGHCTRVHTRCTCTVIVLVAHSQLTRHHSCTHAYTRTCTHAHAQTSMCPSLARRRVSVVWAGLMALSYIILQTRISVEDHLFLGYVGGMCAFKRG